MKKFIRQRRNSISVAWTGLIHFFRNETHAKVHLIISFFVIFSAWMLSVSTMEWIALIFAIGLVIQAEIWNTVLEKLSDFIHPDLDPRIKIIKDLAAAGVLCCVISAIVIGLLVFGPYVGQ